MAARRLLIVMLLLLGISTLAAALLPDRGAERETTEEETAARPSGGPTESARRGGERSFDLRIRRGKVRVIRAKVGDQLAVTVRSERTGLLEVPALGLVDSVAPGAPARFDLLPTEPGSYGIRSLDTERVIARIEIRP